RGIVHASAAPLYAHAHLCRAGARSTRRAHAPARADEGRAAERAEPTQRLPLPHTLPDRRRGLCLAGAATAGSRSRPARRLPLPRTADLGQRFERFDASASIAHHRDSKRGNAMGIVRRMDHFTIVTDKPEETRSFYADLGLVPGARP